MRPTSQVLQQGQVSYHPHRQTGARWSTRGRPTITCTSGCEARAAILPPRGSCEADAELLTIGVDMSDEDSDLHVGWSEMTGISRSQHAHERDGRCTRKGAEWHLPPTVGYCSIIATAAVSGSGNPVGISIRDNPGPRPFSTDDYRSRCRRGGILRFLKRLSGTAVGDFLARRSGGESLPMPMLPGAQQDVAALLHSRTAALHPFY